MKVQRFLGLTLDSQDQKCRWPHEKIDRLHLQVLKGNLSPPKSMDVSITLLISAYSPLNWMDTPACQKAASLLCWPLLKQVVSSSLSSEAAICFFSNVLRGLQIHGQHESCNAALVNLAFQIYSSLRPQVPELRVVMEQIPEIHSDSLQQFDSRLLYPTQKQGEKRRRDHFRRLIAGIIGKPLGEQFRKEVHIRNLPSLFQKKVLHYNSDF
ncbi:unnamed protein product [Ranitomeya imitator]|uniref:Exportin-5 C-terminal domain-containing protein n=1 Tax=Ranitomeya imitator TaxID=111125 RepID=A0ABN9LQS3_9NEOB|nr:unnamed protein product [Ranitomeya imitator]